MWQRIQTLYLLIAVIINSLAYVLTFGSLSVGEALYEFTFYGLIDTTTGVAVYPTVVPVVISIVSMLLSVVVILMFKKRQLQIKLSQLNLFVQLLLLVAIFFLQDTAATSIGVDKELLNYGIGILVLSLPLVAIYLALRAIKKDEALVRAADRIR